MGRIAASAFHMHAQPTSSVARARNALTPTERRAVESLTVIIDNNTSTRLRQSSEDEWRLEYRMSSAFPVMLVINR